MRQLMVSGIFLISAFLAVAVYPAEGSFYQEELISLNARDRDVIEVLEFLAGKAGLNMTVTSNVKDTITLFLKDVTVDQALEIVLASADLAYERRDEVLFVMTPDEFEKRHGKKFSDQKQMKVFRLQNAPAAQVKDVLAEVVSDSASLIADDTTNTVVLFENAPRLDVVTQMVDKLDRVSDFRKLELPTLPLDRQDYYRHVIQKLKEAVPHWYFKGSTAKVRVSFKLSQHGELIGDPELLTHSIHAYWKKLAVEVVRNASPFSPFPPEMTQQEETFEVELAL